ncbi:hypothetical protein B0A48_08292 [Cryoendolithus antarcticus]|uniref:Piwi domain-containing protein n=1 Tax=Cryoendolithus antarcticus TaxID=1507870 RepID=A0A1V8T5C6_9PEZI|nr:hypothetical protein B0A48_08292 [Cryoendolithus antarcticus]
MELPSRTKTPPAPATPNFVFKPMHANKLKQLQAETKLPNTKYAAYTDHKMDARFMKGKSDSSVITNYVAIDAIPSKLYEYSIAYADIPIPSSTPSDTATFREITQASQKRLIFRALRELNGSPLHAKVDWATDYVLLWSLTELSPASVIDLSYVKQGGSTLTVPSVTFTLQSTYDFAGVGEGGSKALNKKIAGLPTDKRNPMRIITALNALFGQHVKNAVGDDALVQVGTNKFYVPGSYTDIGEIHVLRGYFSSVAPLNGYGDAEKYLCGRTVRITYERPVDNTNPNRNAEEFRRKTIASFGLPPNKQTFVVGDKTYTVKQWFEEQGARDISSEFGCPFTKKLNGAHMVEMHKIALRHPGANHASLAEEGLPIMGLRGSTSGEKLKSDLGIVTGKGLLQVTIKRLLTPVPTYQSEQKEPAAKVHYASWNLSRKQFISARGPKDGVVRVLDLRCDTPQNLVPREADNLGEELRLCLGTLGMKSYKSVSVHAPKTGMPNMLPGQQFVTDQHDIYTEWLKHVLPNFASGDTATTLPIVLVLLDSNNAHFYGFLKTIMETKLGVATICAVKEKVKGAKLIQYWANVALKFNIKAGGVNHTVMQGTSSCFSRLLDSSIMVMGADLAHNDGIKPSVAALVGTIGTDFTTMLGSARLQPAREEIINAADMRAMATERIRAYHKQMGTLPRRVLYYRDGVDQGRYKDVNDEAIEIDKAYIAYKKTMKQPDMRAPAKLSITMIVVGKRHNTRFFAPDDKATYPADEKSKTPPPVSKEGSPLNGKVSPGFVVETGITQPPGQKATFALSDFFLQSHCALAGTARSAHYVVVRNDPNLSLNILQDLSHAFCYSYARATKGVSYCAPAYYADRLCDRVIKYLRTWCDENDGAVSAWEKNDEEIEMSIEDGEKAFKMRIRDEVQNHEGWHHDRKGRPGPWMSRLDEVMFWL